MSYDWLRLECLLSGRALPDRVVLYTVNGAGAEWDIGYQADMARALGDELFEWQGIGYPSAAFPMQPSIDAGVAEFKRQMLKRDPRRPWAIIVYSEGAIVGSDILDACGITVGGVVDPQLAPYAESFVGGVTFGNPRREAGHTLPGGIDPGGHGIVTPNLVGTPESLWEFAAGDAMVGSPGQDLYTTCGYRGGLYAVADEEAVWNIVRFGTVSSALPLAEAVFGLLFHPIAGGIGAVYAILDALDFFAVEQLTPHTSYQFIQPVPDDPRDCWAIGFAHMQDIAVAALAAA